MVVDYKYATWEERESMPMYAERVAFAAAAGKEFLPEREPWVGYQRWAQPGVSMTEEEYAQRAAERPPYEYPVSDGGEGWIPQAEGPPIWGIPTFVPQEETAILSSILAEREETVLLRPAPSPLEAVIAEVTILRPAPAERAEVAVGTGASAALGGLILFALLILGGKK